MIERQITPSIPILNRYEIGTAYGRTIGWRNTMNTLQLTEDQLTTIRLMVYLATEHTSLDRMSLLPGVMPF